MSEVKLGKIYKQMAAVLNSVGAIEKNRKNTQGQGYNFRGIDDVFNTMHPIFAEHGIFSIPTVIDMLREERKSNSGGNLIYTLLTVKYTFYADDGSSVEAIVKGEAFDSGDKSTNKAMSAAQKYAILQTFCIPTIEEKDTETTSPQVMPKIPAQPPAGGSFDTYQAPAVGRPISPVKTNPSAPGISDKQRRLLWVKTKALGLTDDGAKELFMKHTNKEHSAEWTRQDFDKVLNVLESLASSNPQNV